MTRPILPASASLVTPAIDQIVALRPEALSHFNSGGRWADLPVAWRAQYLLNLARLGDEVRSARLAFATGDALRTLAASEFNTTLSKDPTPAYATVSLSRTNANGKPAGVIKAGFQFVKRADPNGIPIPVPAATYTVISSAYFAQGSSGGNINCIAQTAGTDGNDPVWINSPYQSLAHIQPAQPVPFDNSFTGASAIASGGSSGATDAAIVAASKAYAVGQFGPTDGAIIAGLLQQSGVGYYAVFRANNALPYASVFVADQSWGSTQYWVNQVAQNFANNWQGFGCRARFGLVVNKQIAVSASITLVTSDALNYTDAIDANVRAAARMYFDGRPDWYRWRTSALQAVLSAADPRILQCTGVTVKDATTGSTLPETGFSQWNAWQPPLTHLYLTDNNITSSYAPPS